jgi:hypothetical protein
MLDVIVKRQIFRNVSIKNRQRSYLPDLACSIEPKIDSLAPGTRDTKSNCSFTQQNFCCEMLQLFRFYHSVCASSC